MAEPVLGILGASTLIGREIRDRLESGPFAIAPLRLFDLPGAGGAVTEVHGEPIVTALFEPSSFEDLDLGIVAVRPAAVPGLTRIRTKKAARLIYVGEGAGFEELPIVSMRINPQDASGARVVAPGPSALLVSTVLHAAAAAAPIRRAEAMVFEPASALGREAMDELFQQAVNLLSFTSVPQKVLGRQLAFNLVPGTLAPEAGGPGREAETSRAIATLLGWEPNRCAVRLLLAATFHCHALLLHLDCESDATGRLASAFPEGEIFATGAEAGATPVEWAGEIPIRIAEVRSDGRGGSWIWALADDLKGGAAENAVRIAEAMLGR